MQFLTDKTNLQLLTKCQKQPDLLTDKTGLVTYSSKSLTVSDTFTFSSHLATFSEWKIVFVEARNRGELTFILGPTHILYLEQTRIINLRYTSSISRKEAKKIRLAWQQPHLKVNVMKRFIFINCSSFALC